VGPHSVDAATVRSRRIGIALPSPRVMEKRPDIHSARGLQASVPAPLKLAHQGVAMTDIFAHDQYAGVHFL
ncbi:MAG: hypothetical protein WCI05_19570, partial [Myxococcales bacterium]